VKQRKLTAEQEEEIRKLITLRHSLSDRALMERYGVSRSKLWQLRVPRESKQNVLIGTSAGNSSQSELSQS
jgi:translation initiation factor RLI1